MRATTRSRAGLIVRGVGWALYAVVAAIGLAALVNWPSGIDGFDDNLHWAMLAPVAVLAAACWLLWRATRDSAGRPRWVSAVMFRVLVLAAIVGDVGWVTLHHP
jgi:chromate transport protein ChrA